MKTRHLVIHIAVLASAAHVVAQSTPPSIRSVQTAGAFGGFAGVSPGGWIEIYGANLSTTTRSWGGSDFSGSNAPTSLDGTSVNIGGQAAFVDYISPGQMNAQVPSSVGTGPQSLIVKNSSGSSAPYTVTAYSVEPGLLAPSSFTVGGRQYVVAMLPDGSYVLPPGSIAGVNSRRASPGDTITLYGVGFGSVTPNISAGQVVGQSNALALPFHLSFGQTEASLSYDGLAPSVVGLYQFNAVVPNVAANDYVPVTFTLNGAQGQQTLYIAVQSPAASAAVKVQSVSLSPSSVTGGNVIEGTVILSGAAPASGATVLLSSNQASAVPPPSVTVAAGTFSAMFTMTTTAVTTSQAVTITATYSESSASAILTVTPSASLSNYLILQGTVNVTSNNQTNPGPTVFSVTNFGNGSCNCSLRGFFGPPVGNDPNRYTFNVNWSNFSSDGSTLTFKNLALGSLLSDVTATQSAQITSASFSVTLNPQGTLTGSFNLVSSVATYSGSFTGTYTSQ